MVQTTALLLIKFGAELEIALVGLSRFKLPKELPGQAEGSVPAYVYVELALLARIKPSEGLASVEALLTANSFVLDKECKLSGGFAFYVWFDGTRKGDFVLTLGGYHPRFVVPPHYPRVPRLAINWVRGPVTIKGEAYFALTPSCVMAGGALEVSYKEGSVAASLTARADFLISWKPFAYDIEVFVGVSASWYSLRVELSAGILIWGPEFAGIATVSWGFISFDVPLGAATTKAKWKALQWEEFRGAFLPASDTEICKLKISSGLQRELKFGAAKEWVVRPDDLALSTESAIPTTSLVLGKLTMAVGSGIGIRPMGSGNLVSTHTITIMKIGEDPVDFEAGWTWQENRQAVPKELWHNVNNGEKPTPGAEVIKNVLVGISALRPTNAGTLGAETAELNIKVFEFDTTGHADGLPLQPDIVELFKPGVAVESTAAYKTIKDSVMSDTAIKSRTALIRAVRKAGFPLIVDGALDEMKTSADALLQFPPMFGQLGSAGVRSTGMEVQQPLLRSEDEIPESVRKTLVRLLAEIEEWDEGDANAPTGSVRKLTNAAEAVFTTGEQQPEPTDPAPKVSATTATLIPGHSAIWGIEPGGPDSPAVALNIDIQPGTSIRVISLDQFGRALANSSPGAGKHPLSRETRTVLISAPTRKAQARANAGGISGWRENTPIFEVTPRTFQASGVTIRSQAHIRTAETKLLRASELMQANVVGEQSGWFQVDLPERIQTIAVAFTAGPVPSMRGLGSLLQALGKKGKILRLTPASVLSDGPGRYVVFFRVPAHLERNAGGLATFQVQAAGGAAQWQIAELMAIDKPAFAARSAWQEIQMRPEPPLSEGVPEVRVSLVSTTEAV
jgi:hypothetical protein